VERYLTVAESVRMYASWYPHPRPVDEVIDLVGVRVRFTVPPGLTPPRDLVAQISDGIAEFAADDVIVALHVLTGWAIDHGIRLEGSR
jgi:hypothetical protein